MTKLFALARSLSLGKCLFLVSGDRIIQYSIMKGNSMANGCAHKATVARRREAASSCGDQEKLAGCLLSRNNESRDAIHLVDREGTKILVYLPIPIFSWIGRTRGERSRRSAVRGRCWNHRI